MLLGWSEAFRFILLLNVVWLIWSFQIYTAFKCCLADLKLSGWCFSRFKHPTDASWLLHLSSDPFRGMMLLWSLFLWSEAFGLLSCCRALRLMLFSIAVCMTRSSVLALGRHSGCKAVGVRVSSNPPLFFYLLSKFTYVCSLSHIIWVIYLIEVSVSTNPPFFLASSCSMLHVHFRWAILYPCSVKDINEYLAWQDDVCVEFHDSRLKE